MSRSKRKTPITSITTNESEKKDKQFYNRKFRHAFKQKLKDFDYDSDVLPILEDYSDVWCMVKDGKVMFDENEYPELMRK